MKILFIGGTGIISSACAQLAIERGRSRRYSPNAAQCYNNSITFRRG